MTLAAGEPTSQAAAGAGQAGRLADPGMGPGTDPRIDPRLLAALATFGLEAAAGPPSLTRAAPVEQLCEFVGQAEAGFEGLYEALPNALPGDDANIAYSTQLIQGIDGNDIALHIYRPADSVGPLPCSVYLHGGGMTILKADNKVHQQWSRDLAAAGLVVIGVDFRNGYTAAGLNPFPAGLNDCASAVRWISSHRDELGVGQLVLQGESGGGNLVLATTLRAKQDGWLDDIDGVYAMVPYISGGYAWDQARKLRELPSLVENDGYFIECQMMDLLVSIYDPTGDNGENPLCWPYFATAADLEGLPPHVISVNELDPLRDEGVAYYRKLLRAGVPVVGRMNLGLVHGADSIFRQALPDVYAATVGDIRRFAYSL
jgi:acetyl esterase